MSTNNCPMDHVPSPIGDGFLYVTRHEPQFLMVVNAGLTLYACKGCGHVWAVNPEWMKDMP